MKQQNNQKMQKMLPKVLIIRFQKQHKCILRRKLLPMTFESGDLAVEKAAKKNEKLQIVARGVENRQAFPKYYIYKLYISFINDDKSEIVVI